MLLLLAGARGAAAQGSAQVVLTGLPPMLSSPLVTDLQRDYDAGRFGLQFIYLDRGGSPTDFRFIVEIEREGEEIARLRSEPLTFQPGVYHYNTFRDRPAIAFPGGFGDLLSRLPTETRGVLDRTGRLPEGTYTISVEAEPVDRDLLIASVPGFTTFEVRIAEPPLLLVPDDGTVVQGGVPLFTWTSATGIDAGSSLAYDLLIVEVLPGQTAYDAIATNDPHVETTLFDQTTFAYTPAELPLESGVTYAWRVGARDAAGVVPFIEDGLTEIYTFVYGDDAEPGGEVVPVRWKYPAVNPFVVFEIRDAVETTGGWLVDGRYEGEVAGEPMSAQFDDVVLAPETFELVRGRVILDSGLTIEAE